MQQFSCHLGLRWKTYSLLLFPKPPLLCFVCVYSFKSLRVSHARETPVVAVVVAVVVTVVVAVVAVVSTLAV